MAMKVVPTYLSAELARNDIAALSRQLFDLQRQSASGYKATDLRGYGEENRQILSTRGEIQRLEARQWAADRAETRLGVQDFALNQATEGVKALRDSMLRAVSQDDGRFLHVELDTAFRLVQSGLNQTFAGQYLFSGERVDEASIRAKTLDELVQLPTDYDIFTQSPRDAVMDIGDGEPTPVAEQAREFARSTLVMMRELKRMLDANGGTFPQQMSGELRGQLSSMLEVTDKATSDLVAAQGRNGAMQKRVEMERTRLSERVDFLQAQVGEAADANLAEIAMRIASAQTQYQAAARVFSQIAELSVLNFLR